MAFEDITKYNTISSLLNYENKTDITYNKLFLKSLLNTSSGELIVNSTSLGNKYRDYIMSVSHMTTLSDVDLANYKYSPKKYCYDTYGTIELWGLLLQINNMTSCTEFNKKNIRVFNDQIFQVLNEILVMEEDIINKNNASIER